VLHPPVARPLLARGRMRTALLVLSVAVLGCADEGLPYGGAQCALLRVPQSASNLPLGGRAPVPENFFQWADPLIAATDELRCCVVTTAYSGAPSNPALCPSVDCEALRKSLTMGRLGGPFEGETCGNDGAAICRAVMQGNVLVGVSAFCFD